MTLISELFGPARRDDGCGKIDDVVIIYKNEKKKINFRLKAEKNRIYAFYSFARSFSSSQCLNSSTCVAKLQFFARKQETIILTTIRIASSDFFFPSSQVSVSFHFNSPIRRHEMLCTSLQKFVQKLKSHFDNLYGKIIMLNDKI